ncbi:MAG TPA: hypothetical protein VKY74_08810 [Chloroflexia bacterium]|nr:hypothetical protein [Chloroflexia bacterium]
MRNRVRAIMLITIGMVAGMLLTLTWGAYSSHAQTAAGCQAFPQTGHMICGKFLDYWQSHGGLTQQGYPLSEEFTETSDLNGKPYTVQYFERAVFEYHPENQPPYNVLLSQLGTFLGKANYSKGFPTTPGALPFYENRVLAKAALKSYYNAISRKEYERAYSYFAGAPHPLASVAPPYPQFVAGYADTSAVTLAMGQETDGAGAGNLYATIPVVLMAQHADNSTHIFSGCYVMHRVNDGISSNPLDVLWSINSARLSPADASTPVDTLLAQPCSP